MSNKLLEIWYFLKQADGEPFRDSSVDKVYVKSTGDIADLRDAITAKNADSLLKGISPASLKVFNNKADLNGDPLKISHKVKKLGQSEEEALWVLPPEPNTDDLNKALVDELTMQISDLRLGSDSVRGQLVENSDFNDAWNQYQEVSALLVDAPEVKELVNLMNECSQHSDRPYVFIEGSSGEGKTQMALTTTSKCREDGRQAYYLLCIGVCETSQRIYRYFEHCCKLFIDCAEKDTKMLKNQKNMDYSDVFSVKELQNKTLYVYGFMKLLMTTDSSEISAAVVDVKPESFEVVSRMVKSQASRPFVFLDEFAVVDAQNRG